MEARRYCISIDRMRWYLSNACSPGGDDYLQFGGHVFVGECTVAYRVAYAICYVDYICCGGMIATDSGLHLYTRL